ncbi:hypothetical protein A2U01_0110419, partial [Trifolium medium]|nr:hypothetical protein [Trifolium medium]
ESNLDESNSEPIGSQIEGWSLNGSEHHEHKNPWHDERLLPSTRSNYAPSPFEQYQSI